MTFEQDPRVSFDSFVHGPGNRMAAAAARRAAESPRTAYNPLFIHGASGVGKTHLLRAVGNHALALRPELRVVSLGAEELVDRVSAAVGDGSLDELRNALLDADLLLLDDVHLLAGRTRTQEELLALWPALEEGAQIVATSEAAPTELDAFGEALRARLLGGVTVELPTPQSETRAGIVARAARDRGVELAAGSAEEIAELPLHGARELIAATERLAEAQGDLGRALSAAEAAAAVQGASRTAPQVDEFTAFLSDIAATVEEIVETAPWRKRLAEAILRFEGEGFRTRRLEAALETDSAPEVEPLLAAFSADVAELRRIGGELRGVDAEAARSPVLLDPDRVVEAEALLAAARAEAERREEEAAEAAPRVDLWYLNGEKLAWSWVALEDRIVEELG